MIFVSYFAEENIRIVHAYVTVVKERIAKLQYQKQLLASQVKIVFLQLCEFWSVSLLALFE
jgi:hypothetical protein